MHDDALMHTVNCFGSSFAVEYASVDDSIFPENTFQVITPEMYALNIPEIAKYHVSIATNTVTIEKSSPQISDAETEVYLYGTVVAYILQNQNYLVLHGSAVLVDGKAVIFSGNSGAGKSTLAASLVDLGYQLLTDDVVAIRKNSSGELVMLSGPARVKLWHDALDHLGKTKHGLKPIINKLDKYELPIQNHQDVEVPILALYELNHNENVNDITLTELYGQNKLQTLMRNTYRYYMLPHLNKLGLHLHDCSDLATKIRVAQIMRPKNHYMLKELSQIICNDLLRRLHHG